MALNKSAEVRRIVLLQAVLLCLASGAAAQESGWLRMQVVSEGGAVAGAEARAAGVAAITDAAGRASLRLPAGAHRVVVRKEGLAPATLSIVLQADSDTTVTVRLELLAAEVEGLIVTATRTERRVEDSPERVELLPREEIEEKLSMRPADIAMMLNETSGMRVQTTSSTLGGVGVRIHGLRGRYTQILSDGLPLYGAAGPFGLLQIPPLDLAQVEVIKGGASALYGASALGGVVNLVSRRPDGESELLVNGTSQGGGDLAAYGSTVMSERFGLTVLASGHVQREQDLDRDGWANVPGYRRGQVRPRLFWDSGDGRSLFVTAGAMLEERHGGTLEGRLTPAGTSFRESLDTRRFDGGLVGQWLLPRTRLLSVRGSGTVHRHDHVFGTGAEERDVHGTTFLEGTVRGSGGAHVWVVGAAVQRETYRSEQLPHFDYTYTVPGVFLIDDYEPAEWLALSASGRVDRHSDFGTRFSPRLSLLLRPGGDVDVRISGGTGYAAPTPFVDETEETGLTNVEPLEGLRVERARSLTLDVSRRFGPLELNATLFGSRVEDPLQVRSEAGTLRIVNAPGPTLTSGAELYGIFRRDPFVFIGTLTTLRSTEPDPDDGVRNRVPLVPWQALSFDGVYEEEEWGRLSFEVYYIGRQRLEQNPYRSESRPHLILGALAERRLGRARVFVNAENLLDIRQTRYDPRVRPSPDRFQRWTVDEWAPLEGRVLNAGVRWEL